MTTTVPNLRASNELMLAMQELGLWETHGHEAPDWPEEQARTQRWLKRCQLLKAERLQALPAGRYAVQEADPTKPAGDTTLHFFKVDKPTEGRWAGYTFLSIQASDDLYPIKDRARKDRILTSIANNPQEAMERYGRELGACGHCGRTLTNETSRARGIGPICAEKMGW